MKFFIKILLWTFVGLLSLGQLQRIELLQFSVAFYIHEIVMALFIFHVIFTNPIALIQFIQRFFSKQKILSIFSLIIFATLIISLFSTIDYISLLYFSRLIFYIIFGFSVLFSIKNNKIDREYLKFQIFAIGLISLFLGFLQYIFIPDTRFLSIFGWDDHYARLISTYFDPGFTGIIYLFTLLVGLSSKFLKNKLIRFIFIFLFSLGIVLTFSRSSYLATIISFIILASYQIEISRTTTKKIIIGISAFILLILLVPKPFGEGVNLLRTSTITARFTAITEHLNAVTLETMLIGNGPFSQKNSLVNTSESNISFIPSHSRIPDNIFMTVFLSSGIFGLLVFITLIRDWAKQLKIKNIYLYAGFVSILIHSQFSNSLLQPFVLLVLIMGVATVVSKNNTTTN